MIWLLWTIITRFTLSFQIANKILTLPEINVTQGQWETNLDFRHNPTTEVVQEGHS